MALDTTTIQVFTKDRDKLLEDFGAPAKRALHEVLNVCHHPEKSRRYGYLVAILGQDGQAINQEEPTRKVGGFYCRRCKTMVFPDATE